jgi:hypothetical protein
MNLTHHEIQVIRNGLNILWMRNVEDQWLPLKVKDDQMQNKYHAWCYKKEQDPMHDFYYIQSARKKLDAMDLIALREVKK